MQRLLTFSFLFILSTGSAQKMLLLQRAHKLENTRFYVGQTIRFRMKGHENYWYTRKITDVLAAEKIVMLNDVPVNVCDIAAIKVPRSRFLRRLSARMMVLGPQLTLASGVAIGYRQYVYAPLFPVGLFVTGWGIYLRIPKKVKLGDANHLIASQIGFSESQEIPPPPLKKRQY